MLNNENSVREGEGVHRPANANVAEVGRLGTFFTHFSQVHRFTRKTRLGAAALFGVLGFAAVAAYAVFSTVPGRIQVAPVSLTVESSTALPAEVRALEAGTAPLLFDRDTRTAHVAYADQRIEAVLDRPTEIRAIKVFGAAPYVLTVSARHDGAWRVVPGLSGLKLADLDQVWNEFPVTQSITAQALRFELTLAGGKKVAASGLAELEIWGTGEHALLNGTALVAATQTASDSSQPQPIQARVFNATPESGVIGADGYRFGFTTDRPAARFKRAWLVYETYGLSHWVSPVRRINGHTAQGGAFSFGANEWTPVTEPIHPDWLATGTNTVDFSLPAGAGGTYSVRNVRVVAELDDGSNFIARATTTVGDIENVTPALVDGDFASAWSPYNDPRAKTGKAELTLYFERPTQLDVVSLRLANSLTGTLSVQLRTGDQWQNAGLPTINGAKLSAGWNTLTGFAKIPADALRITFLNGTGSSGEIREISATGSGVDAAHTPEIRVAYPDAGQFYGRRAYLRGFLSVPNNGSGTAVVTAGGQSVSNADGSFGLVVSKDEAGYATQADAEPWQVQIDAVYPDGQKLTRVVILDQSFDAARAQAVLPGVANPGFQAIIAAGEATLDLEPDALDKPMDIKITPLKEYELPPLDPGMTNVTPGPFRGYRFTPHGAKFKKHVKVTLPYDSSLIPQGLNEQDIKTYYFDTELNRWVVLDRYKVDNGKRKVTSLTDHFTDMINATLTVPDHPETSSYNATQMKDIKAADPGAGINLIEPPQANNMGDARLAYPIEIPPGRLGMQPQLAVQYNSSGGNGWMGLGWDLSTPAISVDTRWGVPRYDENRETETYLLNGEMLTPVAHRGALVQRNGDGWKQFYTRVEGAFQKIIRHGNSPRDYWWEVTDKNGVTNIYGGENGTRHGDSTLGGDKGTFRWALRKTVDTHGNTVVYHYDKPPHAGVSGSQVMGQQLYISRIAYTGSGDTEGRYSVVFKREGGRPDISVDARGRFKQVTADLLKEIEVRYRKDGSGEGDLVRRYELLYTEGAFKKTLLDKIVQYGADGAEFNRHAFAYYDDIRMPETLAYRGFLQADRVETGKDDLKFKTPAGSFNHTVLGGTEGETLGFEFYAGIGANVGTKNAHVGMSPSRSISRSEGTNAFFDVDGDGLPDKVFIKNGAASYRRNVTDVRSGQVVFASETGGAQSIGGFAPPSASQSETQSHSIQGKAFGATASNTISQTDTRDMSYLADINGDGLVDVVNRGSVLFNTARASGKPNFSYNSFDTDVALGTVGRAVDNRLLPNLQEEKAAFEKDNPLMDNVRLWKAPYDGIVRVSGGVRLLDVMNDARFTPTQKNERSRHRADGVRVAIQHKDREVWSSSMGLPGDADPYRLVQPQLADIVVKKGDTLYFRVQSNEDGAYDIVAWSPTVEYVSNGQPAVFKDANNLNAYRYQAADDFVLANRPMQMSVPHRGTVKFAGMLNKIRPTTDDVTLQITVVDYRQDGNTAIASPPRVVTSKTISKDYVGAIVLDEAFAVEKMSGVWVGFSIDSPIDLSALKWGDMSEPAVRRSGMPELYYTEAYQEAQQALAPADLMDLDAEVAVASELPASADAVKVDASAKNSMTPILDENGQPLVIPAQQLTVVDEHGEYIYKMPVKVSMDLYPVNNAGAKPQEPWIAPRDGFILWTPWVTIEESLLIDPLTQERRSDAEIQQFVPNGSVFVTAKRDGIRLAKHEITVANGAPSSGYAGVNVLRVKAGDRIFFDATLRNQKLEAAITASHVAIHYASDTPWIAPVTDNVTFVTSHQSYTGAPPTIGEPVPDRLAMVVIRKGDEIVFSKLMNFALTAKFDYSVPQHVVAGDDWYVDIFTVDSSVNVTSSAQAKYAGRTSFSAPQAGTLSLLPLLAFNTDTAAGDVTLAVLIDGVKRAEHVYAIAGGKLAADAQPLSLNVSANQTVTFEYAMSDALRTAFTTEAVVVDYADPVEFDAVTIGVPSFTAPMPVKFAVQTAHGATRHMPLNHPYFGNPYRGWAFGAYNGNGERKNRPIDASVFVIGSEADYKDTQKEALSWLAQPVLAQNPSEDGDSRWWLKQGHWGSSDDAWWVSPLEVASSRNGLDTFYDPQAEDFSEARAEGYAAASRPPKMSRSRSVSGGGGFYLTAHRTDTEMKSRLDVMDMNGDRFPDIVSDGTVQYTWADGTFFDTGASGGTPRETSEYSVSIGLGFGDSQSTASGTSRKPAPGDKIPGSLSALPISGNANKAKNNIVYDLIDMNGDGLPDKVEKAGNGYSVRLNTGYRFLEPAEIWKAPTTTINKGESTSIGGGASGGGSFSSWNSTYGGGFSVSEGHNHTNATLMDINGDGLPDYVTTGPGNALSVWLNTGAGFSDNVIVWPGALRGYKDLAKKTAGEITLADGGSTSASLSGKYSFSIAVWLIDLSFSFAGNVGMTVSQPALSYVDVNGDGFVDGVRTASDDAMEVAINPIGRTNMLKSVQRPLGAKIDIDYERSGNTHSMPQSRYVMSRVTVHDGQTLDDDPIGDGPDTLETHYTYDADTAVYDRYERDFYGYRKVVEAQIDTGANTVYRSVARTFHNKSYYTKGLLEEEVMTDSAGRPYTKTLNTYALRDESAGGAPQGLTGALARNDHARVFPLLVKTERSFFEGGQGSKTTHTTFDYDTYGNVIRFVDAGDEGSADDVEALINYSTHCTDRHIVGKPVTISVLTASGLVRERNGEVDCATGNMTRLNQVIGQGKVAETHLTYHPNGNLASVTGPANHKGQRYALNYEYDPAVATHVVGVSDSFGYRSSAAYDYRFGKPVSTTDLNGNVISTAYDTFGRTVTIHGPYEQGGAQATLRFAYFPDAPTPYAVTEHLNIDAAGKINAPIDTVLFTDGIKRVVQTKKRASVNGQTMMIVSGRTVFDGLGRTVRQYYPVVEPLGQAGTFNLAKNSDTYHTATEFDVLDRTTKTTLPDATVTTMAYGFGRDRDGRNQFSTVVTDANGNKKESYRDIRELITAVREFNKGEALWTSYAYDPLKQIVEVKDVKGVLTKVEYDMLGRRTVIDNPDTGRTVTVYDPASNVVQKITANLAAAKKAISYDYDYNRLKAIRYPVNAANDVSYEYGAADLLGNGSNQVGRLVKVTDASGSQELHYGRLGETVKEIRIIASHTQGQSRNSPEVYTTQYRYDSFGRMLELVLPDTETITYVYDAGGSLTSFAGEKSGTKVAYLNLVHYDKFEQRTRLVLGNGIETKYAYDAASRRLDTLTSAGIRAGTFQNLHYGYDNVGNILNLHNNVAVPPPTTFGGPNKQQFGYDDLYRLTAAKGEYKSAPDKTRNYTLDLTYDTNHNILAKKQSDVITVAGGSAIPQKGTSYDWQYDYAGSQPHAPTHIGQRSFTYDLNGNQTGWQSDVNGTRRHILWDEENRIAEIDDNGHRNRYVYDAKGERTVKLTKQGETVYVNQYYVVKNRSVVSKHLYAGTGRIVTHLVMGTAPGNEGRGAPGNGHASDKTPTTPETGNGNSGNVKDNNGHAGNDKEKGNNGLHLGQLKNGRENPGQGRDRRSDVANAHAQDVVKNPTLTGEHPGQGSSNGNGSAKRVIDSDAAVVITEGDASVEINGDTTAGEVTVDGVTESFAEPVVNGQSEFIWYYHPDHLGSTGFVTDQNGELYEHTEYFPFGETWVQEKSNTQRTPYLYTGKELDEETGLYYYGARYYDPRTSVWASADPILGKYLPTVVRGKVQDGIVGGVYVSSNLALYTYGRNSPVVLKDPDGNFVPLLILGVGLASAAVDFGIQKMEIAAGTRTEVNPTRVVISGVAGGLTGGWANVIKGLQGINTFGKAYGTFKGAAAINIPATLGKEASEEPENQKGMAHQLQGEASGHMIGEIVGSLMPGSGAVNGIATTVLSGLLNDASTIADGVAAMVAGTGPSGAGQQLSGGAAQTGNVRMLPGMQIIGNPNDVSE